MSDSNKKPLCIYHADCVDGFSSAWVAAQMFGPTGIELWEAQYNSIPPDVTGRDVYIVDFSYKREVLRKLILTAKRCVVLDHHVSAAVDLQPLIDEFADDPRVSIQFDMNKSGVGLTWEYFFQNKRRPKLLQHIEEYDLHQFRLDETTTRLLHAAISSYPYTLDSWSALMCADLNRLVDEGHVIQRKMRHDVTALISQTKRVMLIGGYVVSIVNAPRHYRDMICALLYAPRDTPFAAAYYDTNKGRVFSLRSPADSTIDLALIAKSYGGGGHKHAASFTVPLGWEGDERL